MNAIIGLSELAIDNTGDETVISYLEKIKSSGHYLLGIINDILDINKIEGGQIVLHPKRLSLAELMDSTTVVLGLGNVGSEFAWRMHALGSKVIGVKRTPGAKPDFVDELCTIDKLDEVIPQADIIAVTLPATKDTYHLIGKAQFELMR